MRAGLDSTLADPGSIDFKLPVCACAKDYKGLKGKGRVTIRGLWFGLGVGSNLNLNPNNTSRIKPSK